MKALLNSVLALVLLGSSYGVAMARDWKNPVKCWENTQDLEKGYYCCLYNDGGTYCDDADGPDCYRMIN